MKTPILFSLALIAVATSSFAAPDEAPFVNKQLDELSKKIDQDLTSGTLSKTDGDELKREISEVRGVEQSEPSLTAGTRRDMREKVSKIQKDLERKEAQAQASASPSPAAAH